MSTIAQNAAESSRNNLSDLPRFAPKTAHFRFYEELNDLLPKSRRKVGFEVPFFGSPAIKDTIESLGVPHTEVDLIVVNGVSVGFDHRLESGDRVAVYPVFGSLEISSLTRLRPAPLRHPSFVLDVHLGKLAKLLRLLGFDALYRNDYDDMEIALIAQSEKRAIFTRDVGLLKIGAVTHGYWIRSTRPLEQAYEVLERFDLHSRIRPFSRCMECNAEIVAVDRKSVLGRIPEKTAKYCDTFFECPGCRRIYWRGSHYAKLVSVVDDLLKARRAPTSTRRDPQGAGGRPGIS
jgi:uncharacterized protein with PIN domain